MCSISLAVILEHLQGMGVVRELLKHVFKTFILKLSSYFLIKRPLIGVNTTFSSDLVVHFFCGPFLPHGVTNANCILFSKVGFFNHMLIH